MIEFSLTKDEQKEAEFIDDAMKFWNAELKDMLVKVMTKVNEGWQKQIAEHGLEKE